MIRTALILTTLLLGTQASAATAPDATVSVDAETPYVLSSRNTTKKPSYAYSNPLGVGPANDSR